MHNAYIPLSLLSIFGPQKTSEKKLQTSVLLAQDSCAKTKLDCSFQTERKFGSDIFRTSKKSVIPFF